MTTLIAAAALCAIVLVLIGIDCDDVYGETK